MKSNSKKTKRALIIDAANREAEKQIFDNVKFVKTPAKEKFNQKENAVIFENMGMAIANKRFGGRVNITPKAHTAIYPALNIKVNQKAAVVPVHIGDHSAFLLMPLKALEALQKGEDVYVQTQHQFESIK